MKKLARKVYRVDQRNFTFISKKEAERYKIAQTGEIIFISCPDMWIRIDTLTCTYAVGAYEG